MFRPRAILLITLITLCLCSQSSMAVYNADLGRWITRDPLRFADGPNLYGYVRGNPLIMNDPDGQIANWLAECGLGALLGGAGGFIGSLPAWLAGEEVSPICGALSGAITGCCLGVVCGPELAGTPLCYYGSCFCGMLGAVASEICNRLVYSQGFSLNDPCFWFGVVMSIGGGCLSGVIADHPTVDLPTLAPWAKKIEPLHILEFVLGVNTVGWMAICPPPPVIYKPPSSYVPPPSSQGLP